MRKYIILLILAASVGLTAQNYQTIISSNITTFIGNDNQQVESIRIDSSFVDMGDSIFYPFYNIQQIDYECYVPFSYSWIGKKIIIKPDGYNYFINKDNDTIKINTLAQLNENWIAYETPNIIVVAEVIQHDTLSFLGQTDSAKTISFTAYDQSMTPISHPVNTMTISISEHFGLLKTVNFSQLAENISSFFSILQTYDLLGMSSPPIGLVNLTWKEIYDFDIGDEILIVSGYATSTAQTVIYITEIYEKYIYLDKTIFTDSMIYKIDRTLKTIKRGYYGIIEESESVRDTIIISYKRDSYLDKLSGEWSKENIDGSEYLREVRMEIGDVNKKTIHLFYQGNDNCWSNIWGCYPFDYLKGLGGPYYSCNYPVLGSTDYCWLQYYKKGDKTWGTPLSIDNIRKDNENLVKVYPNPAAENIYIELDNENLLHGTLRIITPMGQVVLTQILTSNKEIIPVEHLSSGMYIIQYNSNNKISQLKFVKM